MIRILLVEDDAAIVSTLCEFLENEGFSISAAETESKALALLEQPFDLALPVIFLTASGDENSVVKGLDMGADDYITKPFRPRELISRIKSVLRRSGAEPVLSLQGGVTVDPDRGTVMKNGEEIRLSALEYRLLLAFLNNRGRLLTRNKLLEDIWDVAGDFVNDNTLTVYIKRLREKLGDEGQEPQLIKTVRGLGYRMD